MNTPPPPLEWHPFYRDKTWLLDWLEQRGSYADLYDIRIPIVPSVRSWIFDPDPVVSMDTSLQVLVMTRQRAAGPAPYVGQPFHYEWTVGVDNLGRCIASDSRIVYVPEWRW